MRFLASSIVLSMLLVSSAHGATPDGNPGCGAVAQRACCVLETDPAGCDTGNREVLTVGDLCPGGVFNAGLCIKDTANPNEHTHCGGDGQRACCTTEGSPSCDTGNIEIASTGGTCPGSFSGSAGHCVAITACGGPGQRACCNGLTEFSNRTPGGACNTDAAPVLGCVGNCYCGGIGTGQVAVHTCVGYQTACGGDGQRACCVIERPADPCDDGLVAIPGISGDATCSDGITTPNAFETCVSSTAGPIAEPDPGWTPPATPRGGPLRGYADMHVHLLSHLAHGGSVFAGHPAPIGDDGSFVLDAGHNINTALSPLLDIAIHGATGLHIPGEDTVGFGTNDGAASIFGAPYFNGWPLWNSTTHQQVYYKWLERAWRGGLRLMTMLAVTNEALCASNDGTDCDNSMGPINEQLDLVLDFERFIDDLSGGPGTGWFRIVRTPAEARTAIRNGKMAVVLGIEVDNLFNCKETGCAPPFDLGAAVDDVFAKGVRHVFPVHNFDNAFGAAATWQDAIGVGQAYSERRWWEVEDCGGTGNDAYGFWLDPFMAPILALLGFEGDVPDPLPTYTNGDDNPNYASCNTRGLRKTPGGNGDLGARLLDELMDRGMIIDIDHMSRKALDDTLAIASARNPTAPYPVVASHVQFFALHEREFDGNAGRHERMRTAAQLAAIKAGGGMIAAMLKEDVQDTGQSGKKFTLAYTPVEGDPVADDCRTSSKTWAQSLQYGVDVMDAPVAMGSDFNGVAGHVGPRFGSDACGGAGAPNGSERALQELAGNRVSYPFTISGFGSFAKQTTGYKAFDYNVDGLAHIGLLPDLVADLDQIGVDQHYIDALFCSAEKYIRVWERGLAIAAGQPVPDPDAEPWLCTNTGPVAGNGVLEAGEECDDGNIVDGDGCSAVSIIEPGYDCTGEPSVCTPICGDSLVVGSERCDEGTANGTGTSCCSASCTFVNPCEIHVIEDTFMRRWPNGSNEGANTSLVMKGRWNGILVAFDLGGRDVSQATSASLVLTLQRAPRSIPATGREVVARPLSRDFAEGNAAVYQTRPKLRGSGPGATAQCAVDADIAQRGPDCSGADLWEGANLAAGPPGPALLFTRGTLGGTAAFDVTADVAAGATSWLVRKIGPTSSGTFFFHSREGAAKAGVPGVAPRLVLTFPP